MISKRRKILFGVLTAFAVTALLAGTITGCVAIQMGEPPDARESERYDALPNHSDGKFLNREPVVLDRKKIAKSGGMWRFLLPSENAPDFELPAETLTHADFPAQPEEFAVVWLGHSTLIFELGGSRFLTDPVFGNAAPLPGVLRRYRTPPLPREELPELDFILISHDHYDHLEYRTIRAWRDRDTPFVVPLGVGARLRGWGIAPERIHELNWGESLTLAGVRITAQTSRHFSGRSIDDRDRTLWASFVLEGGGKKIFFGGDGGYGGHFREIGETFGPFDLTCLEIDAWNERWPNNHLFPEQALQAHRDLGGKLLLPIHWGVFDLAMHPWSDSIEALDTAAATQAIPLVTPRMGQRVTPGRTPTVKWWRPTR